MYNAETYLAEAIESILSQTFTDFELLIINDGSTDNSKKIINSFSDNRIRLVDNETNIKLIATLNKGIDLARGKYIARMDADDISVPTRLEKQVTFMESHPEVGVCGSWFETFGNEKKTVKYPEKDEDILMMLLHQTPFCHPTIIFRKEVFEKNSIRFLPEFLHAEEYDVWVRLAGNTRFANIPEVLLFYRQHEASVSNSFKDIQTKNTFRIIRQAFKKAGVEVSDEEIFLYRDIAYSVFNADQTFINNAEKLLLKLVDGNRRTKFLPQPALEKFVFERWFHLCYNISSNGLWVFRKFRSSQLSRLGQISIVTSLKFLLKSIIAK